uniref:Phospholipid scramblase n=1 Tax=Craspedostauros australis TaxID=1486917 RepID=A0A7R9WW98_9STRA|mmetsp:Transcript_20680/g.57469  ORF Transcript_20680/g.57469 Transcript_20680/m.57469 type:complete len:247 (+) Transcript_20680:137-877(+)
MEANKMEDRGSNALKTHMAGCQKLDIRQTRRGWCQELLGCEALTEFKYFMGNDQVFHSIEEASCCCRFCCSPVHPYKMTVKELNTDAELVTIDRPMSCMPCGCKCCCYQVASFTSDGTTLGSIKEDYWYCVPSFKIFDSNGEPMYKLHQPTCCGGVCVNCCAEGNPCGKGCCKASFRVYPADQQQTNGDAPFVGSILRKPKSVATELFTDAQAFEVDFPENSSADQKGILMGTTIFINTNFFEAAK